MSDTLLPDLYTLEARVWQQVSEELTLTFQNALSADDFATRVNALAHSYHTQATVLLVLARAAELKNP